MKYEIIPCRVSHVIAMSRNLREGDAIELAALGRPARHTMVDLYRDSILSGSAFVDGEIAAVWGFSAPLASPEAEAWLFTSPAIERAPLAFLRETRAILKRVLKSYDTIVSACDAGYLRSLQFFDLLGFSMGPPVAQGTGFVRQLRLGRTVPERGARTRRTRDPFIIFALGRSRTAWLSTFLSYREWTCYHEYGFRPRSLPEAWAALNRPCTGYAETAAAPGWPLVCYHAPRTRFVVVRRDVETAIRAMEMLYERAAIGYDKVRLRAIFEREARDLERISRQPGCLTLDFAELDTEQGCQRIFEFCLPFSFDRAWWLSLRGRRIEADLKQILGYYWGNKAGIDAFQRDCRHELFRLGREGAFRGVD